MIVPSKFVARIVDINSRIGYLACLVRRKVIVKKTKPKNTKKLG